MKKVIIIDDESLARSIIKRYLESNKDFTLVAECNNGFEGIKAIDEHQPDLVFLDVQMPKITGFEMLEILENPPAIIFTTAFDEYAVKAFDANAIDYLLKPFSKSRFESALDRFSEIKGNSILNKIENSEIKEFEELNRIVIKNGTEIQIIPIQDVTHLEAYDDYVKIHTLNKCHVKKKTMNFYENNLPNTQFLRVHRSYIINVNFLTKIESFEKNKFIAKLNNDASIPISRTSYPNLRKLLGV